MSKTYKLSINRAIEAANRHGPGRIDATEAKNIHRLLSGRHGETETQDNAGLKPGEVPGVEVARFLAALAGLGVNVNTANRILGVGRASIYRYAAGTAQVPDVVWRLIDMYERFGVPVEHQP